VKEPEEVEVEEPPADDVEAESQFRDRLGADEDEDEADAEEHLNFEDDETDPVGRAMPADTEAEGSETEPRP
jgi:hypothetical protein